MGRRLGVGPAGLAADLSLHGALALPARGQGKDVTAGDVTSPLGVPPAHEPYCGECSASRCARECLRLRAYARALPCTGPQCGVVSTRHAGTSPAVPVIPIFPTGHEDNACTQASH